ncbi:MAG: DUF2070 family protein [Promethearchaeota archaeon]
MQIQGQPSRQAPGLFTYFEFFSTKVLAYSIFISAPIIIGLLSFFLNGVLIKTWDIIYLFKISLIFLVTSFSGVLISVIFYSRKSPILRLPPHGWTLQLNAFFGAVIGGSFLFGELVAFITKNNAFIEVFFMLGTIISYIIAFVIYFSFTMVRWLGRLILSLTQPVVSIILYYFFFIYTGYVSLNFFFKAIVIFCICAFFYTFIYGRGLYHVSNVYRRATGLGGYGFIRAFVLSMLTERNDGPIEELFDRVGKDSDVRIQYLAIRSKKSKNIKGLFVVPHVHFGPFKTCGSSDLPELIYKKLRLIPGTTVYHTTNDHTHNLTKQKYVDKVVEKIIEDVNHLNNNKKLQWSDNIIDFSRKISNSAKLIGFAVGNVPIIFVTRHPLPSDDIQSEVGDEIRKIAKNYGFNDVIIVDAHNAIIGDEVLIVKDSLEAKDIINVSEKFFVNNDYNETKKSQLLYGVASDPIKEYSEKDGIGNGGIVVHLFKNVETNQKTALIHFDGNNAFVEIRSFILNMLQNRGIEKGEITTSDSHTVARQFTSRGYSPIGDKIKIDFILKKLEKLLKTAHDNLEPVEFIYYDSKVENVRIWGDHKYFEVIISTLQECIKVSQKLLTYSLIIPTLLSLILLSFYYNISLGVS